MQNLTIEQRLARHDVAAKIIADIERQHRVPLNDGWRETLATLILQGAEDHQLHLILDAIELYEFDMGRLEEAPHDPAIAEELFGSEKKTRKKSPKHEATVVNQTIHSNAGQVAGRDITNKRPKK